MRLIDAAELYEKTAEWEAQALHMVEITMNDEDKTEWRKWSAILGERSAFKFDVADAPTVDAVPVIRCRDCIYWKRYCRIVDGVASNHVCGRKRELDGLMHRSKADDFCSWAKRRNDETD